MKTRFPLIKLILAITLVTGATQAADETSAETTTKPSIEKDFRELVGRIQGKIAAGQRTEEALSAELKDFDALIERHSEEKTEAVARAIYAEAMLYLQIFHNEEKGLALVKRLDQDFSETTMGDRARKILASVEQHEEAGKAQQSLQVGQPFPDFTEKDLNGNPLSISMFKGKVVLVDFWATWCGPCVYELPNVIEAYRKYHDDGFEIVGISLDQDRDKLTSFMKKEGMSWPQYFDGKGWGNKLARQYGINSIPSTYLLDKEGKIIASDLRGDQLSKAVARLLGK